ncbi:MAG: zinc-dependent metalloprotease [Propionibacteriaceae bacterium]|jgi:putative hydrolase|nr:zinc-dependent metalloprotease [Propionibacteriaceae bacterium]
MDIPDFGDFDPNDESLQKLLQRLGIKMGPDGKPDLAGLMRHAETIMRDYQTQMAGFGETESASGLNWGYVLDTAKRSVAQTSTPTPFTLPQLRDAVGLAELWLDDEIAFGALSTLPELCSRQEWLERSYPTWKTMLRPVVTAMVRAQQDLVEPGDPLQIGQLWKPMMKIAANQMMGTQIGESLGKLASNVLSSSDTGLPLIENPQVILLPENIASFAEGLEQSPSDLLLFLALREAARQRLFAAINWLGPGLLALVDHYASDTTIDPEIFQREIEDRMRESEFGTDPEFQNSIGRGLMSIFSPARTPAQDEILERLETLLALIEGWVDEVVSQVTKNRMPSAVGLTEMMRRRSGAGGPAQAGLKTLVGIELRPRRTRDAANLWAATRAKRGADARDATWRHPDLLPTTADLADPLGFAERGRQVEADDFDSALAKLLDEEG